MKSEEDPAVHLVTSDGTSVVLVHQNLNTNIYRTKSGIAEIFPSTPPGGSTRVSTIDTQVQQTCLSPSVSIKHWGCAGLGKHFRVACHEHDTGKGETGKQGSMPERTRTRGLMEGTRPTNVTRKKRKNNMNMRSVFCPQEGAPDERYGGPDMGAFLGPKGGTWTGPSVMAALAALFSGGEKKMWASPRLAKAAWWAVPAREQCHHIIVYRSLEV
ncbi:hypothetical protein H4582DRAFT_2051412 [Lactarius indigo]|nr:hypothetical protein H4582DRAFT_2051412 [Lactarius indigo]